MKKKSRNGRAADELDIPETPPGYFKDGVMGKYYRDVMANSNVVRIAPELAKAFSNEQAVNDALRELLRFRESIIEITKGSAAKRKKTA